MFYIGIDPDMHDLAIAGWANGRPRGGAVVHVPKSSRKGQRAVLDMIGKAGASFKYVLKQIGALPGGLTVAVEGQQWDARARKGVRPIDIIHLGQVTGAVVSLAHMQWSPDNLYFPTPTEWKGGVAKHAMQARLYDDLGWGYTLHGKDSGRYARPKHPDPSFENITAGQWKHIGDAILLARWAEQQTA